MHSPQPGKAPAPEGDEHDYHDAHSAIWSSDSSSRERRARSASSGCLSCARTGTATSTTPSSVSAMPRSPTVTSISATAVASSSRPSPIVCTSPRRRRAGCAWALLLQVLLELARRRLPRISLLSLASRCTFSTVHPRWTTARWAISSRVSLPLVRGVVSTSLIASCLRYSPCAQCSISASSTRRSARQTCLGVVLTMLTRKVSSTRRSRTTSSLLLMALRCPSRKAARASLP